MQDIDALRKRVRDLWFVYTSAQEQTKELQREKKQWGDLPAPDGQYEVSQAQQRENRALINYRAAIRELNTAVLGKWN